MSNLIKKLSLIIIVSIVVVGTLVYFAIGETRPMVGHIPIDSVSATVIKNDSLMGFDTTFIVKDTLQTKIVSTDTTEIEWQSKWGKQTGEASWYGLGDGYHGKRTASGVIFDTYSEQCAHRFLPFGTILKVENLNNGKTTIVKVTDRGPFAHGRIIDLSHKSKTEIGMGGTAKVKLTVLSIKDKYSYKKEELKKEKPKIKKDKKVKEKKTKKYTKTTKKTK